jgi:hypothetical protein
MCDPLCAHEIIIVTYLHPYGDFEMPLNELIKVDQGQTRQILTVTNLRCVNCQQRLTAQDLVNRLKAGGDLYDPRLQIVR